MAVFHCPTKLYTGPCALDALRQFQVQRTLIVTDSYFSQSGRAAQVGSLLPGTELRIFDKVVPDPPAALAAEGAALCRRFQPQLLIALGGGSSMDCAKAIRLAAELSMTFLAIPTTSGSGSEVTSFSILTHDGVKEPLVDDALRPDAAILDDTLLQELPAGLIADCGMDLLAHCLEALVATNRSGFTDALAIHGVRTVLELLKASRDGDKSVRLALHEAATMAGMAFDNAGLGICHALAHAMGGALHLPHGRLCAMLLPGVLSVNAKGALSQYAALARACGLPGQTDRLALRNLTGALIRLRRQLGLPENLKQAGVDRERWRELESGILDAALDDPCCATNPIPVTRELLCGIIRSIAP